MSEVRGHSHLLGTPAILCVRHCPSLTHSLNFPSLFLRKLHQRHSKYSYIIFTQLFSTGIRCFCARMLSALLPDWTARIHSLLLVFIEPFKAVEHSTRITVWLTSEFDMHVDIHVTAVPYAAILDTWFSWVCPLCYLSCDWLPPGCSLRVPGKKLIFTDLQSLMPTSKTLKPT